MITRLPKLQPGLYGNSSVNSSPMSRPPENPQLQNSATDEDFVPKHVYREKREESVPLACLVASGTIGSVHFIPYYGKKKIQQKLRINFLLIVGIF